ncbi:unnamed protein product, partial [Rotaria magnacalcarata]
MSALIFCLHSIIIIRKRPYYLSEDFNINEQASNDLKEKTLSTVQCAEFGIPSCHYGSNESIHIGKNLVPFLSTYMPHLQILRLWRPDDFPWTS